MFPEGTSICGDEVLPFRPSLFEVAVRTGSPVRTAALSYRTPAGAAPADLAVCWWGDMGFAPHFIKLLTLPSILARVSFGPGAVTAEDRKDLALRAHGAVSGLFEPVRPSAARTPTA